METRLVRAAIVSSKIPILIVRGPRIDVELNFSRECNRKRNNLPNSRGIAKGKEEIETGQENYSSPMSIRKRGKKR